MVAGGIGRHRMTGVRILSSLLRSRWVLVLMLMLRVRFRSLRLRRYGAQKQSRHLDGAPTR